MTKTATPTEQQLRQILDEAVHLAAAAADTAEANASNADTDTQEYADDLMIRAHEESQQVVQYAKSARDSGAGMLLGYVRLAVTHAVDTQAVAGVEVTAQPLLDWLENPGKRPYPIHPMKAPTTTQARRRTPVQQLAGRARWRRAYTWAALALALLLLIVR